MQKFVNSFFEFATITPMAPKTTSRLVLIDGNAILHRAYHALPPLTSRDGTVVNAVYGFWTMTLRVVGDLKPDYLVVAFDTEKPTFRHAAFVGYQAHRPRLESDLAGQIGLTQETLKAAGIPVYFEPGYEADDVIGSLAFQAVNHAKQRKEKARNNANLEIIIVTGDRDLLQLVNPNVKVYMPVKGLTEAHLLGEREVAEYLGISPSEVVDYKALIGDPSDNYPGVPGIGPKTAIGLLKKYKSLAGIYEALAKRKIDAPQSVISKLAEGHDSALLSQDLAKIRTDVPLSFNLEEAKLTGLVGNRGLVEKLKEIGFKSLVARLEPQTERPKKEKMKNKKPESQLKLV